MGLLTEMVGGPVDIDVHELEFIEPTIAKLIDHKIRVEDVEATFANAPQFFENLPGRSGTHVMLGPDADGRFFYIVLIESSRSGVWRVITGYRYSRRRALRFYRRPL